MYETKDSGKRRQFSTWMVRDTNDNKPRFDLIMPKELPLDSTMMYRLAMLLARWAKKYTERNREQANTQEELDRFKESAFRHFMQRFSWEDDEDHAAAVLFNIQWAEFVKYKLLSLSNK